VSNYDLSILIPVHSTRYLKETLESIKNAQRTEEKWQLVVVLDRVSTFQFQAILENPISGIDIKILTTAKPGIVEALNLGLKESDADLIARIDEDDLVTPDRFYLQWKYLNSHPKIVAVGGALSLINSNGDKIGKVLYPITDRHIRKVAHLQSPIAHPASMFRRQIAISSGGYRNGVPEDWDLWLRLLNFGELHNLPKIVIAYRQHPDQLSRTSFYQQRRGRRLAFAANHLSEVELSKLPTDYLEIERRLIEIERIGLTEYQHFIEIVKRVEKYEDLKESISRGNVPYYWGLCIRLGTHPILFLKELSSLLLREILLR
jgi:glycosyltransferase involved in cell wall biosynthesis